jgi:hypothetical protein
LVQKLIALTFKQKVLIFRKIYTPKFLGCYRAGRGGRAGREEEKGGPRSCLDSILFMSRDTQISNSKALQIETSKSHLQAQPKKTQS